MTMKVRAIISLIKADGWYITKRKSTSHRQFKHPTKKGKVTVNGSLGDDLSDFLVNSILRQAGLK